jgi:hypothetical protein
MRIAHRIFYILLVALISNSLFSQEVERKDWFIAANVDGVVSQFNMNDFNENILKPMEEMWGLKSTNMSYGFGTELGLSMNSRTYELAVDGLYLRRNINGMKPAIDGVGPDSEFRFAVEGFAITHSFGVRLHNFGQEILNILSDERKWNLTIRSKLGLAQTAVWREDHYIYVDGEDQSYDWGKKKTTVTWANEIDAGWRLTDLMSVHLGVGYRVMPIGKYRRVEYTGMRLSEPDVKYRVGMSGFYGSLGVSFRLPG